MGRHSHSRALNIWMNGELLGQWTLLGNGTHELIYADSWYRSTSVRPLSVSLPMTGQPLRGRMVENYFDNLLPDSTEKTNGFAPNWRKLWVCQSPLVKLDIGVPKKRWWSNALTAGWRPVVPIGCAVAHIEQRHR